MTDEISTDDLFGKDDPQPAAEAPRAAPKADAKADTKAKPKASTKAKAGGERVDNAVNIRTLDWECACGNTNTHNLDYCGKCRAPRYTTN